MSAEENKIVVRRFFDEVCNEGNYDVIGDVFADEFNSNGKICASDTVREYVKRIHECFQKPKVRVDKQVAEEDWVSSMRTWKGVQVKEYNHHPATNKKMKWLEISVVRLVDEKIVEDWVLQGDLLLAE